MPLEQYPGTEGFIDDVYANPDGVPMCSGYFELRNTDAPLDYYYAYDEMKVVLEGEFRLENPDTGQVQIARAKDAIFFPKGLTHPVLHPGPCAGVLRRLPLVRP